MNSRLWLHSTSNPGCVQPARSPRAKHAAGPKSATEGHAATWMPSESDRARLGEMRLRAAGVRPHHQGARSGSDKPGHLLAPAEQRPGSCADGRPVGDVAQHGHLDELTEEPDLEPPGIEQDHRDVER